MPRVQCRIGALSALSLLMFPLLPAHAQSTFSPQADWNGTYGFASSAEKNFRILQSDIIEKKEQGYYDQIGQVTVNNNTNTINNSVSSTVNDIGQQQTTIGVVSNATNNVKLERSAGAVVDLSNIARTDGCVDSTIHIDAASPTAAGNCAR